MKVTLLSWTNNPIRVIAAQQKNMRGEMVHDLSLISQEEAEGLVKDVFKTSLMGSLEFVDLVWSIEDVTRAFTHQLCRYRVGTSYSQESMRFTDKSGFKYLVGKSLKTNPLAQKKYAETMENINNVYKELIDMGVETQDARGVLPTNIFTKIGFKCTYRTLYNIAETRLCLQAQEQEWQAVIKAMKVAVAEKVSPILAEHLQPLCVHSGFCGYGSIFDRKCPLQEKYPIRK